MPSLNSNISKMVYWLFFQYIFIFFEKRGGSTPSLLTTVCFCLLFGQLKHTHGFQCLTFTLINSKCLQWIGQTNFISLHLQIKIKLPYANPSFSNTHQLLLFKMVGKMLTSYSCFTLLTRSNNSLYSRPYSRGGLVAWRGWGTVCLSGEGEGFGRCDISAVIQFCGRVVTVSLLGWRLRFVIGDVIWRDLWFIIQEWICINGYWIWTQGIVWALATVRAIWSKNLPKKKISRWSVWMINRFSQGQKRSSCKNFLRNLYLK